MTKQTRMKSPRVSTHLNNRLAELNISRTDFIRKFHKEYGESTGAVNHLYKVLNGTAIVGEDGLLPLIVESLGLDMDEVVQLVRADKIYAKDWAQSLPKANEIVRELAAVMESLSERDQSEILQIAKIKAGRL